MADVIPKTLQNDLCITNLQGVNLLPRQSSSNRPALGHHSFPSLQTWQEKFQTWRGETAEQNNSKYCL